MTEERFRKGFLLLLVVAISAAFLSLIRTFLLTILLAAIFAGLFHPLYRWLAGLLRGRHALASVLTLLILIVAVMGPLLILAGIVTAEALRVSENVRPWVERSLEEPGLIFEYLQYVPYAEAIEPYRIQILTRLAEMVGDMGGVLFNWLSATTRFTVVFLFHFGIFLYTMFFLLKDGPAMLRQITRYLPLSQADADRMLDKFVSVTRATLKGTVLIGVTQGGLGGLAFWAVGIDGAIFWAMIMTVLSIIPGIGAALVWVPAVIILIAQGQIVAGLGLLAFCGIVVGSVDNILRPRLVGRDTKMHDLLILFSTLGGILVLGPAGFIVGPIIAALFITIWEMFGVAYRQQLSVPPADPAGGSRS